MVHACMVPDWFRWLLVFVGVECRKLLCSDSVESAGMASLGDAGDSGMSEIYEYVKANDKSSEIFGPNGYQCILRLSAACSHQHIPIACCMLAAIPACTNGGLLQLFPNKLHPMALAVFNVNYSQTRKSTCTDIVTQMANVIDEACLKRAAESQVREGAVDASEPVIKSVQLVKWTVDGFWSSCSSESAQVVNHIEAKCEKRLHNGVVFNVDEAYRFLSFLGCTGTTFGKGGGGGSEQELNGCEFNDFMQSGTCQQTNKTQGSFGRRNAPPLSISIVGNIHPPMAVKMEQGLCGNPATGTTARFLFVSGPIVEVQDDVHPDLKLPDNENRHFWVPMEPDIWRMQCGETLETLNLASVVGKRLTRAKEEAEEFREDDVDENTRFAPDEEGYKFNFPSGCTTRLRFSRQCAEDSWQCEYSIPNRYFSLGPELKPSTIAKKIVDKFPVKNTVLELTEAGRQRFRSLSGLYNDRCTISRKANEICRAPRYGYSALHLGQLSACLMLLDVACDQYVNSEVAPGGEVGMYVQRQHVSRAFLLLELIHGIRDILGKNRKVNALPTVGRSEELVHVPEDTRRGVEADVFNPSQAHGVPLWRPLSQVTAPLGYGYDGATVQVAACGEELQSDAGVLRKTLLKGASK